MLLLDVMPVVTVFFLVFLEGLLSLDNALVLALMVRHLPAERRKKALTYGIYGAFLFRVLALFTLSKLMEWTWVKYVGGAYLIAIAAKGLWGKKEEEESEASLSGVSFWKTVVMVELVDILFSADSILAAVSLSQSYWIVLLGGILGMVMMRFAAAMFVELLRWFPRLETTAYLLVLVIGSKLIIQALGIPGVDFHSASNPAFWGFWVSMAAMVVYGLTRRGYGADTAAIQG